MFRAGESKSWMVDWRAGVGQAIDEFRHRKMRTALTLLGMIFGVAAVISMLSVGAGAEREALSLIDTMGLRNVIVKAIPQEESKLKELREKSLGLTLRDLEAARETLPFAESDTALKRINTWALFSARGSSDAQALGVSPSHFEMVQVPLAAGRPLHAYDDETFAQVAVLGSRAAADLFGNQPPVGQRIKINHLWFTVVGVLADRSLGKDEFEGVRLGGDANAVYVPVRTALKKFRFKALEDELDEFHVQVREGVSPTVAAKTLSRLLESRHRGVNDFTLLIPEALLEQHRKTQRIFTIVMSCIAGISLLVGGIGIMNIMLATVLERTREIGIRRALGARRRDIKRQFVLEALTVTAIGGAAGILFGFALATAIALFSGWPVAWSPVSVVLALTVCVGVGLLSGIYPAVQAARLDPIEALRRET
jgi:putative ABC transport system permease protein